MPLPSIVRLEYLNRKTNEWYVGHGELGLIDPDTYVKKLLKQRGIVARATDIFSGETWQPEGVELL